METYYQKNREKLLAKSKEYYQLNREARLIYSNKYSKNNPDKMRKYAKTHRDKHTEENAIYYKEWYKNYGRLRSDRQIEQMLEWKEQNPEKIRIQAELNKAVRRKNVIRPEICPKCNRKAKIHAHHINYTHFMNFIWLCASCHKKEHIQNNI